MSAAAERRSSGGNGDRLPVSGLLALAMTGFVAIMTETLPAGLLPEIGTGLGVSEALAGQLTTFYAAGSLMAAIPLTAATQAWRRRTVLLVAIAGFLLFNTVTAFSSVYALTLAARFLAGVAAGLAWGTIAGHARRMVSGHQQGRALAIAMVGTPVALSVGVPAGSVLGLLVGWRSAFVGMSVMSVILIAWVLRAVPDFPGKTGGQPTAILPVFLAPGVRPVLTVVLFWMLAHNILYTYAAPFAARAGLGRHVDFLLLVFGVVSLVGIGLTGLFVDKALRTATLASLSAFGLVAVALGIGGTLSYFVLFAVALWGLTFGGAATLLCTAAADAAGEGVDLAQAMVTTAWNSAIAGGGLIGGLLLAHSGAGAFAWAMLAAIMIALAIAWTADRHGFPRSSRTKGR